MAVAERSWDVVVVGAGPAGLAAAAEAERRGLSAVLLEAGEVPGGLARSFERDGYTFDCSGHLLHLSRPEASRLVEAATPAAAWRRVERRAAVRLGEATIPYPFQLHLAYAPERVRRECLEALPAGPPAPGAEPENLGEWIEASLGAGIGRHFMVPYNEKLAGVPVGELTTEWLGRFVPRPSLEAIRAGAARRRPVRSGYNASFLYPAEGGIATLSRGLAGLAGQLETRRRVVGIDAGQRRVDCADGSSHRYRLGVVATAPLPGLAAIAGLGERALAAAGRLRANSATCVNLGLRGVRTPLADYHWIYLPEARFSAYRIGFYGRSAAAMAPPGREGVYVEIANSADRAEPELVAAAVADLRALGVIAGEAQVETALTVRIEPAYVLPDRDTAGARSLLSEELRRRGIWTAGRYARWEYSAIEDALVEGAEAVAAVAGD